MLNAEQSKRDDMANFEALEAEVGNAAENNRVLERTIDGLESLVDTEKESHSKLRR